MSMLIVAVLYAILVAIFTATFTATYTSTGRLHWGNWLNVLFLVLSVSGFAYYVITGAGPVLLIVWASFAMMELTGLALYVHKNYL